MTKRPRKGRSSGWNARSIKRRAKGIGVGFLVVAVTGLAWLTPWLGRGIAVVLPRWWAQVVAGAALALLGLWNALLMQRRPIGGTVPRRPQAVVGALYLFAFLCVPVRQAAPGERLAANGIVEGGIDFVLALFGAGVVFAAVWFVATRRVRKARHDRELSDWEAFRRDPEGVARRARRLGKSPVDPNAFGAADVVMVGAPVAVVAVLMVLGGLA